MACNVQTAHLSQVWGWNGLKEHHCFRRMRNLDPVHAFRFSRSGGIYMQWKQWCTDESWSRPVLLVPQEGIPSLAPFRPPCLDMVFSAGQSILDWINRFEMWCSSQPVGQYHGLDAEFQWLRAIVHHQVPGEYSPGTTVDALLRDLRALPHSRPQGPRAPGSLHSDTITQLFPGADIPSIPAENLVKIDGITHTHTGRPYNSLERDCSWESLVGPCAWRNTGAWYPPDLFGGSGRGDQRAYVTRSSCSCGVVRAWHGPDGEFQRGKE